MNELSQLGTLMWKPCGQTALSQAGCSQTNDTFDAGAGIAVEMFDPETDEIAASWSLERMANSWNAKHASAMYVPAEARTQPSGLAEYRFGKDVLVGEGTDVFRLLRAIHVGLVWYDPADSIYADGKPKVRPQWRAASRSLEQTMKRLYSKVSVCNL